MLLKSSTVHPHPLATLPKTHATILHVNYSRFTADNYVMNNGYTVDCKVVEVSSRNAAEVLWLCMLEFMCSSTLRESDYPQTFAAEEKGQAIDFEVAVVHVGIWWF